jgi:N-acetylglutamate synthase-like GNAT family acetyltransferase
MLCPINPESIALIKTFMSYTCRPARIGDLDFISALSEQWGYLNSRDKMFHNLQKILKHSDHMVILIEHQQVIAGWIHGIYSFRMAGDPFVEIAGLVVDSRVRRQGMGKFLVGEIVQWAKKMNCSLIRVRCHIVRKEANLFYSDFGFQEIKQQKVYDLSL